MRKELHTALVAGVLSVGNRVYPLTMPQDTNHKCLVYKFVGSQDTTGITCVEPINTRFMVQIDCLAKTYGESVDLAIAVKKVLRANFLTFGFYDFEDYLNITLKYRQVISVQLELRPVFSTPPLLTPKDCALSVGNTSAIQYNIGGFWYKDCKIFKA